MKHDRSVRHFLFVLTGIVVLASFAVLAGTSKSNAPILTWVGGDSGNFETASNWQDADGNSRVPQHYDILVFPKGGTFTKNSTYLTLWGVTVTSPDPVTINTGALTFENNGDIIVSGAGAVTFEGLLKCGYHRTDTVNVKVAAGSTANFDGEISGPRR